MIIISNYKLYYESQQKAFLVISDGSVSYCPLCGGELSYRDSRKRIRKKEGGIKQYLIIRRLRCKRCCTYHNELPDCLVPHKHYDTEIISGVLDGIVKPDDSDSEDYPCIQTMLRWFSWLNINVKHIEDKIQQAELNISGINENISGSLQGTLSIMRSDYPDWLERILPVIYNNGDSLLARC